jgi:hypothetical protein
MTTDCDVAFFRGSHRSLTQRTQPSRLSWLLCASRHTLAKNGFERQDLGADYILLSPELCTSLVRRTPARQKLDKI